MEWRDVCVVGPGIESKLMVKRYSEVQDKRVNNMEQRVHLAIMAKNLLWTPRLWPRALLPPAHPEDRQVWFIPAASYPHGKTSRAAEEEKYYCFILVPPGLDWVLFG